MGYRVGLWLRTNLRWYLLLVITILGARLLLHPEGVAFVDWFARLDKACARRIAFVMLVGVPVAQLVVGALRWAAARASGVAGIPGAQNAWPQRIVGATETAAYALAFGYFDAKDVVTGFGAWITLKNFGDWFRLKSDPTKIDKDESRRRLYVFLFANALNLAAGGTLGWTIKRWARQDPSSHVGRPKVSAELPQLKAPPQ